MTAVWTELAAFLGVFTLAIVSPGPNFVLVVNRSLAGGRADGVWSAFGVALGSGLYGTCGLLGWIVLLDSLPHFSGLVRLFGGGYLVFLGAQMALNLLRRRGPETLPAEALRVLSGRPVSLVLSGLATNLSNPKAWAFYLSLFTVVLAPDLPVWAKVVLNLAMFWISFGWYALVATLLTRRRIQPGFRGLQRAVQGLLGGVLIYLGLALLRP